MNTFEELHDVIDKLKGCVQQAKYDLYNAKKEWCTKVLQENFSEFLSAFYWYHSSPVAFGIDEIRYTNPTFEEVLIYMSDNAYMNIIISKDYNFAWNGLEFRLLAANEDAYNAIADQCEESPSVN